MIWHILKYILSFSIPSFYRKIQIKNVQYLKNNRPAIICSNHPNAFMDPIAFSYMVYPPRVRYMARGDAFKPGIVSRILQSIGIVPIFRMQDAGAEGVKKNNESYRVVYDLLKRNKKVMIFAEGICVQEKRLRPVKKGVPRLIFNAQQILADKEILVIPVCLNYSEPSRLGSTLFINVGEPFVVKDRMQEFDENPNAVMLKMMDELYQKMLPLIVHIANPANDKLFEKTREVLSYHLCRRRHLNPDNLEDVFVVEKEMSEVINRASLLYPEYLNMFSEKVSQVYSIVRKYEVSVSAVQEYSKPWGVLFLKVLSLALVYVVYDLVNLIVRMFFYLPYMISHRLAKKLSASVEFYASFFLALSTFIFLFYFILFYWIMKHFVLPFVVLAFIVLTMSFVPLLHYFPVFKRYFITLLKILKNKTFALNLSKNIEELILDYEHLKKISFEKE
ncbi:MAG: hypothetical protein KatS3mg028_0055 [Bacteroidia bacterium]|nr:MAG: hypothetical protein KatS3mg028_0055 [Bacteroidia bacterium]